MNAKNWLIIFVGLIILNLGLGGWNLYEYLMIGGTEFDLLVSVFGFAVGFWILYRTKTAYYPAYLMEQKAKNWRER
jgi:hypothetical protein